MFCRWCWWLLGQGRFAALLTAICLVGSPATATGQVTPLARRLADYTNEDGRPPDGQDNGRDDTVALQRAFDAGPGVVYVGSGHYRWGRITVPSETTVVGAGPATVVQSSGSQPIFLQKNVHNWTIRDLLLDGATPGDWKDRKEDGQTGILTEKCRQFQIVNVTVRNFNGAGVQLTNTDCRDFCDGGSLHRVKAIRNYIGIRFGERAEYVSATQLACTSNVIGCVIHAGNTRIATCNFGYNVDGLVIRDRDNGSHGTIHNCLMNHNQRYALLTQNVRHGMTIGGCCFFYGSIRLEDSVGVNINSSIISCDLEVSGAGINRIAANYIIPRQWNFDFTPTSIVADNFTAKGLWDKNHLPKKD